MGASQRGVGPLLVGIESVQEKSSFKKRPFPCLPECLKASLNRQLPQGITDTGNQACLATIFAKVGKILHFGVAP